MKERRNIGWKRWSGYIGSGLTVFAAVGALYLQNKSTEDSGRQAIAAAQARQEQLHTNAVTIRSVQNQRLDEADRRFEWTQQQIEDLWKECRK